MLNKSFDLLNNSNRSFNEFRKQARDIKEIKLEWNEKMKCLQKQGYAEKKVANLKTQQTVIQDLVSLKGLGGPFTSADEIADYLNTEKDEKAKILRLYTEVRYAKNTSLTLQPNASLFRLRTAKQHKLTSDEYASNLSKYLDNSTNVKT